MEKSGKTLSVIGFLFKVAGVKYGYFILAAFLSMIAAVLEGVSVSTLIPLIKGVIEKNFLFVKDFSVFKLATSLSGGWGEVSSSTIFILLLSTVFISAVMKNVITYLSALLVYYEVRKIADSFRQIIFNRYLSFGKLFFDKNNTGHLQNILLNFTNHVTAGLTGLEFFISGVFMLAVYLAIMFFISWKLTLVVLMIYPVLNNLLKIIKNRIKKTSFRLADAENSISSKIADILSCIPLVKVYAREKEEGRYFAGLSRQLAKADFSIDKKSSLVPPLEEIITLIAVLCLVAVASFIMTKGKPINAAGFFVYFYLIKKCQTYNMRISWHKARMAVESGRISAINSILDDTGKYFITEGVKEFKSFERRVECKNLNFSYGGGSNVLNNVNAVIEKGKMTAIVGPTGSGKTTLINLILRFYDCPSGAIFVDGEDIRGFTIKSLMSHMALVPQDTLLFNDTFRNNISYGYDVKNDAKLIDVLKKARLYDFVTSLPSGVDTYVGDKGVRLSGGEKQRVAIARALFKECEILILDEATSSLDTKTERLVQEAIDEAIKDRTAIVIAHRLSTIKNADKIIVMNDGSVIEEGVLDGLLQKKGKFFEYWQEQKFY